MLQNGDWIFSLTSSPALHDNLNLSNVITDYNLPLNEVKKLCLSLGTWKDLTWSTGNGKCAMALSQGSSVRKVIFSTFQGLFFIFLAMNGSYVENEVMQAKCDQDGRYKFLSRSHLVKCCTLDLHRRNTAGMVFHENLKAKIHNFGRQTDINLNWSIIFYSKAIIADVPFTPNCLFIYSLLS